MKLYAVICEYNPFHNGHKYLIDTARQMGATHVAAIMGGHFLQRGDVAIADKWTRTSCALGAGADIVIELPAVFATASAERFAYGGVAAAQGMGCVDHLIFGSEEGNIQPLGALAEILNSTEFMDMLKEELAKGISYPKAVHQTIEKRYDSRLAHVLESPNNTLAIEYMKALKKQSSAIVPLTVKREGAEHDSRQTSGNIASASYIRQLMLSGDRAYKAYLDEKSVKIMEETIKKKQIGKRSYGERVLLSKLRQMTAHDFKQLPDVSEGLENRIYTAVRQETGIDEIINKIKTKRYTRARIRRILMFALLGITKEMQAEELCYLRVLGFTEEGADVLKQIDKTATLPVITKLAEGMEQLTEKQKSMLMLDIKASNVYGLFTQEVLPCSKDFTNGMVKE